MIWVMALVTAPVAADEWAVESAGARVPLTIEGDMYAREEIHLETVVNFNELLRARTLRADSLTLVDAATGEITRHAQTLQAYADAEYRGVLAGQGFEDVRFFSALGGREGQEPDGDFVAVVAGKP